MATRIQGLIEARRAFAALPELHRDLIVDVHTQAASAIARGAIARVRRRTGLLALNIAYEVSKRTGFAKVGVMTGPAYYGHFVEFKQNHPFMQPSYHEEEGRIESRFITAGRDLERKAERIGGRFL